MTLLYILVPLIMIAGISAAIMWTIQFHWEESIFFKMTGQKQIWFSPLGWTLKYKDGKKENGPAFFGSTTVLVFLTDAFHFFQFLMYTSYEICIGLLLSDKIVVVEPLWVVFLTVAGIKLCRGFPFELFFKYILMDNFWQTLKSRFVLLFTEGPRITSLVLLGLAFLILVFIARVPSPWDIVAVIATFTVYMALLIIWVLKGWKKQSIDKDNQI